MFLLLGSVLAIIAFYHYGRPLWGPYYLKLAGKDSVEDIMARYEEPVRDRMAPALSRIGRDAYPDRLMLIAIKEKQILEMWGQYEDSYVLIKEYPFTGYSGELGPKLEQGDGQIPEGEYGIEYLNPNSSFHLSMKVSYPNDFDREKGESDGRRRLGDDIMIHGRSATIGCIPVGDEAIEELFVWVVRVGASKTGVLISPVDYRAGVDSPSIVGIDWEDELYAAIKKRLLMFKHPSS